MNREQRRTYIILVFLIFIISQVCECYLKYVNVVSSMWTLSHIEWRLSQINEHYCRYINKIQHFINNYSNSNKWSLEEKNIIKKDERINKMIFGSLIEMKLIQTQLNIIEFNQFEISNFYDPYNKLLLGN